MAVGIETIDTPTSESKPRIFVRERLIQAGIVVLVLVIWEIVGQAVGPFFLAPPSAVARAFVEMLQTGELLAALRDSLYGLAIGYALALLIGLTLGTLMGWFREVAQVLDPFISAVYVVPTAALVPLLVLWFGVGMTPRVITIVLFAVFEVTLTTMAAVRGVDPHLVEMARAFGGKPRQIFSKIVFFDALPVVFSGIRIGAGRAVQGMVTAEILFAVTGLGGVIMNSAAVYRLDKMLVVIVVVSLIGVIAGEAVQVLERRLTPWNRSSPKM